MLEPEIAAFIERATALYPAHTVASTPREQRQMYDRYAAMLTPPLPDEIATQDAGLTTDMGHSIALRLYRHRVKTRGEVRLAAMGFD